MVMQGVVRKGVVKCGSASRTQSVLLEKQNCMRCVSVMPFGMHGGHMKSC